MSDGPDDLLPVMASLAGAGTPFALVTLHAADGGPRPVGSQMVVTAERFWGFLSGGCVESDVARHAREVLMTGESKRLAYGRGSPFLDIRLPCGGRIDLLIEALRPDDIVIPALVAAAQDRRPLRYLSDGQARKAVDPGAPVEERWTIRHLHEPLQRLAVVGGDPFALAIAGAGVQQGWEVTLIRTNGPATSPPLPVAYSTAMPEAALGAMAPDPWTAVAVATHDAELDHRALLAALTSNAGYVGVLGSRRRLEERKARLLEAGLAPIVLTRLRAPIGLPIAARSPREIAVAVIAEILERRPASIARADLCPVEARTAAGAA